MLLSSQFNISVRGTHELPQTQATNQQLCNCERGTHAQFNNSVRGTHAVRGTHDDNSTIRYVAPMRGRMVQNEALRRVALIEAGQDHDNDSVQLDLRYTRRTCNIGFFSRLRELNPDSSYTVMG
jgi:hypothetical protein